MNAISEFISTEAQQGRLVPLKHLEDEISEMRKEFSRSHVKNIINLIIPIAVSLLAYIPKCFQNEDGVIPILDGRVHYVVATLFIASYITPVASTTLYVLSLFIAAYGAEEGLLAEAQLPPIYMPNIETSPASSSPAS